MEAKKKEEPIHDSAEAQHDAEAGYDFKALFNRAVEYLKGWPREIRALIQNTDQAIRDLPNNGSWEKPLTYVISAALASGFLGGIALLRVPSIYSARFFFSGLFSSVIVAVIFLFVGSFILNFLLSLLGKEPGYYKTAMFGATWYILVPAATVIHLFVPLVGIAASLYYFYQLYKYALVAAEVPKKTAQIAVGVVAAIGVGSLLLFGLGAVAFFNLVR